MKVKFVLIYLLALIVASCKDDDAAFTCADCVSTPDALAANDESGKGIYKGLVVGSTGTIVFDMDNDGGGLSATLTLDGQDYALTTEDQYSTEYGFEGYFSGTLGDSEIEIGFYVNETGDDFELFSITIPGHEDATIQIFKELSSKLVRVFEGTYSGDKSGTFNMVTRDNQFIVTSQEDGEQQPEPGSHNGTISTDGTVSCDCAINGKISGDEISGTWTDGDNSGTWKGRRTL